MPNAKCAAALLTPSPLSLASTGTDPTEPPTALVMDGVLLIEEMTPHTTIFPSINGRDRVASQGVNPGSDHFQMRWVATATMQTTVPTKTHGIHVVALMIKLLITGDLITSQHVGKTMGQVVLGLTWDQSHCPSSVTPNDHT